MKRTITTPAIARPVVSQPAEPAVTQTTAPDVVVYTPPFETMETAAVRNAVPSETAPEPAPEPAKPKSTKTKGTQAIAAATDETAWKQQSSAEVVRRLEHELLNAIYSTEKEVVDLQAEIEAVGAVMARLKEKLETTWQSRDDLLAKLPAQLVSLREGKPIAGPVIDPPPVVASPAPDLAAFTEDDPDPLEAEPAAEPLPERWQDIPTRDLIADIDRLGPTRLEAIAEAFPTLADLNAARRRAGQAGRHFCSEFPKGTGKIIADSIESALLTMVGRYGETLATAEPAPVLDPVTDPKSEAVKPSAKPSEVKPEPKPEPAKPAEPKPVGPIAAEELILAADSPRIRTIRAIARSVAAEATEAGLRADAGESWVDGFEAGKAGAAVDACPELLEMSDATDWVKGWVYFRLFARVAEGSPAEVVVEPAEVIAEPVQAAPTPQLPPGDYDPVHADFVRQILDWLKGHAGEMKQSAANSPLWWSIGAQCFEEGEPAEECPTEKEIANGKWADTEEIDQVDWLRGWLSRKLEIEAGAKTTAELTAEDQTPEVEQPRTLESVFEIVTAEPSPRRPKDSAADFSDGYTAALSERPWLKCPHDPTADLPRASDWMRGWIEGAALDSDL